MDDILKGVNQETAEETGRPAERESPRDEGSIDVPQASSADSSLFTGGIPSDPFAGDPFLGKLVGNCHILQRINEGGSSYIYRARNINFDLDRVVKILKPSLSEEADHFERFKQEAQLTARLDHPNILRIFDTGEIGRQFFIEMEYVEGETLRAFMASHPRPNEIEILGIASQVVAALEYAHSALIRTADDREIQGILHRDIKPENIMITGGRFVKLMDFGAAKPLSVSTHTLQGTIVGTPHYMSPEQIGGEVLDARSDFFSLGVVLYELCTGKRPFEADNLAVLLLKIDQCEFQKPRKLRRAISSYTEELIECLLSKKPHHRPGSAAEIQKSLQFCIQAFRQWGSGNPVRIPFSIRRAFPALGFALAVAALAVSGLALWKASGSGRFISASTQIRDYGASLINRGIEAEKRKDFSAALSAYGLAPPPEEGGDRDAYLQGQILSAALYLQGKDQLSRAQAILERLRRTYEDPAIDAYLGQLYFSQALYLEAKERLEAYLNSDKPTVLNRSRSFNPEELEREALFAYASALEGQYTHIDSNPELLDLALGGWERFVRFSTCSSEPADKRCRTAEKRIYALSIQRRKN